MTTKLFAALPPPGAGTDRPPSCAACCTVGSARSPGIDALHPHDPEDAGEALDAMSSDTVLEKVTSETTRTYQLLAQPNREDEVVGLLLGDRPLWLPRKTEPILKFVLGCDRFAPRAFPTRLSQRSKLKLAKHLVREGFLKVCD